MTAREYLTTYEIEGPSREYIQASDERERIRKTWQRRLKDALIGTAILVPLIVVFYNSFSLGKAIWEETEVKIDNPLIEEILSRSLKPKERDEPLTNGRLSKIRNIELHNQKEVQSLITPFLRDSSPSKKLGRLPAFYLAISRTKEMNGLSDLQIENLSLSGSDIRDIKSLPKLTNLKVLELNLENLEEVDLISPKAPNLKEFNLRGTRISNLEFLKGLDNLEKLYLSKTPIKNLGDLAQLSNLETLSLSYTQVATLSPLVKLDNLTTVLSC